VRRKPIETAFNWANVLFMLFVIVVCVYPFVYILAISFNDGIDAQRGGIFLYPRKFSLENYKTVFKNQSIMRAYGVTVYRTVIGTLVGLFFNALAAFALAKNHLPMRRIFYYMIIVPMYFWGGLIPFFIVIMKLGLLNNLLVYIIPGLYVPYYMILLISFFKQIPASLEDSARIDGASEFLIFWALVIPVSKPVLAAISLFLGVWHWNDWYDGYVYMSNSTLWPIQTLLLNIIKSSDSSSFLKSSGHFFLRRRKVTMESVKMATIIISVAPIIMVYPFLQRYFVKGIMIGSLKG